MALTRRKFVASAAACGAFTLFGCSNSSNETKNSGSEKSIKDTNQVKSEKLETDVVVVGSGLAGMSTAASAVQNGLKVILIEKGGVLAPSFFTSKGNISLAQVPENKDFWAFETEPDTMNAFIERYANVTEIGSRNVPYPDYERVKPLMLESCKTVSWLEDKLGMDFEKSFVWPQAATDTVKPSKSMMGEMQAGQAVAKKFEDYFNANGIKVLLNTSVTELITDNKKVKGIIAESEDSKYNVTANKVVLACGGYGANEKFINKLLPKIKKFDFHYLGNDLNTGDGIKLVEDLEVSLYEDNWLIPFIIKPHKDLLEKNQDFNKLIKFGIEAESFASKILLNSQGERFVNEAALDQELTTRMVDSDAGPYYMLYSSDNAEVCKILDSALDSKHLIKGESIDELQKLANMPALVQTVNSYLSFIEKNNDDDFKKPADKLKDLGAAPYYLVEYNPSYVTTLGGIEVNENYSVLDKDKNPISGLYAVGELSHRYLYNRSFVRNCSNSIALTSGRILGENLSKL